MKPRPLPLLASHFLHPIPPTSFPFNFPIATPFPYSSKPNISSSSSPTRHPLRPPCLLIFTRATTRYPPHFILSLTGTHRSGHSLQHALEIWVRRWRKWYHRGKVLRDETRTEYDSSVFVLLPLTLSPLLGSRNFDLMRKNEKGGEVLCHTY